MRDSFHNLRGDTLRLCSAHCPEPLQSLVQSTMERTLRRQPTESVHIMSKPETWLTQRMREREIPKPTTLSEAECDLLIGALVIMGNVSKNSDAIDEKEFNRDIVKLRQKMIALRNS